MKKSTTFFGMHVLLLALLLVLTACNIGNGGRDDLNDMNQNIFLPYDIDNTGCIKRFYANERNSVNIVIPSSYSIDENGKIISGTAYEVKTIGAYCFANNKLIESVSIPDTIITIEERAFYNCSKMATINITHKITCIGKDAFESCPQLKTITKNGKSGLIIEENNNLSSFTIPSSISKLEDDSFANWVNLTSISIGENIDYIGNNAFSHCKNLSRVSIDTSLNYLGNNAFFNCEKLTALTTSNNNSGICFAPHQSLSSFVVPLSITSIQDEFFYGWKQLKELTIHGAFTTLGTIFKDNENLTKLTCGYDDILSLFYHRPDYEPKIESTTMYIVSLKPYSTSHTYNYYIPNTLTEIHLLKNIDSYCLYNMKSIQKVYIPSTVSEFGYGAFAGCSGLTNVYFETDSDWSYSMSSYPSSDYGTISQADMNNSKQLAIQLKEHNGYYYRWYKS